MVKATKPPSVSDSIFEGKQYVQKGMKNGGVKCPCCGKKAKIWTRGITSSMAKSLINLVRRYLKERKAYHISQFYAKTSGSWGGDFALMRHWGLIEGVYDPKTGKRIQAMWTPTDKGIDFVLGKIRVIRSADTYNGKILAWSEDKVDIRDALGNKFDYDKLVAGLL